MTSLKELDLSRCTKVTDVGIKHLTSISSLEELRISETGVTASGVALLSSLKKLSVLDLGGLPVTDLVLRSLQVYYLFLSAFSFPYDLVPTNIYQFISKFLLAGVSS